MPNTVPFEVLAATPIALYTAPADTAKVSLDDDPDDDVAYSKLGVSGDLNYDDGSGVQVESTQDLSPWMALGDSGTRKIFRQKEECKVKVKVADMRLETLALALNSNGVTTVPAGVGTLGYKWVGLSRGLTVATKALLIRLLISPYGADWIGQYYFPRAAFSGNASMVWKKAEPVGLEMEWTALVNPDADDDERFGRLEFAHADATT